MRPASVPGSPSSRPAVSTTVKARSASRASPSRRSRVTPGSSSTSASLRPTSRLNSVDLPTFGRPMIATLGLNLASNRFGRSGPALRTTSLPSGSRRRARASVGQLTLVRRDFWIAEHEIELLGRVVIVAARAKASAARSSRARRRNGPPRRERAVSSASPFCSSPGISALISAARRRAESRNSGAIAASPATASKAAVAPGGSLCALAPAAAICASAR